MRKNWVIQLLAVSLMFLIPTLLLAQPEDPGGDPDVPIDGGLSLLLAAGVAYGAKKGYDFKKRKNKSGNAESFKEE